MLPHPPTVLHPAEKGSPGSGGQDRRSEGGIGLDLNLGCTHTDEIHGDLVVTTRSQEASGRLTCTVGELGVLLLW